ncbi:MAG: O-methyltransferase [Catalinimonas sp.]
MNLNLLTPALSEYVEAHTEPEGDLLRRIGEETERDVPQPRMLSGYLQGRVLANFAWMLRPKRILEIGTYTGYSALCLAEGLADGGRLITIDRNEALAERVRGYFAASPLGEKIDFRLGPAAEIIPQIDETFDLVFIDADKGGYGRYFDLVIDRVRPGGFIVADNVLWKGKVVDPAVTDRMTEHLRRFNEKCRADPRVACLMLPIRDGLLLMRKV